jgi:hypothetical protein
MIAKCRFGFFFLGLLFSIAGKAEEKYFAQEDLAAIFTVAPSVATYVHLDEIAKGNQSQLPPIMKEYGVTDSKLPRVKMDGKFIAFDGLKVKLDLSKLEQGELNDGKNYFRFRQGESDRQNLERLTLFLSPSKKVASLFIPEAYAGDLYDGKTVKGVLQTAAGAAVAIVGTRNFIIHSRNMGFVGYSVGLKMGVLGVTAVYALAAESLIKAGIRNINGTQVICKDGLLFLKAASGKITDLSNKGDLIETALEQFSHSEIGAAEMNFRKILCKSPAAIHSFSESLQTGFAQAEMSQSGGSTEGAR